MDITKDVERYLQTQESMQIVGTRDIWDRVKDGMYGEAAKGKQLPWPKLHGFFDVRPAEMTGWTGHKGQGKSLVLSHVTLHLASQGETILVISPEFAAPKVVERTVVQACARSNPPEYAARMAVDWLHGKLWVLNYQGAIPWQKVLGCLRYAYDKYGITQAVVDSLMKCGIAPDDFAGQKAFVDRLQVFAHDTGCHVHLVAHARKGLDEFRPTSTADIKGTSELGDMPENIVSVWRNKKKELAISMGRTPETNEDAMLVVCDQRNHSWTGAARLWFHPCGQFLEHQHAAPTSYLGGGWD